MKKRKNKYSYFSASRLFIMLFIVILAVWGVFRFSESFSRVYSNEVASADVSTSTQPILALDTAAYDHKLLELAFATTTITNRMIASSTASTSKLHWPVKTVYPNAGAILPFNRVVAYYGNFYSKGMGILGQYDSATVLQKLTAEVKNWQAADPSTPVIPAIDYIAVTAQGSAGKDGKYRLRMPDSQIDQAIAMAAKVHGIVILDVQVALSNLQTELPLLEKYLKMPQVHLAIDPEFAMHNGAKPGTVIGSFDARDVNYAATYLASLVKANNLPPKILIVHRFTQAMVTNYKNIKPLPEVQIVMDMDGWGGAAKKIDTYQGFIASEPVQFTGFKLFYKNDFKNPGSKIMTPAQVLKLKPQPIFIQYQ